MRLIFSFLFVLILFGCQAQINQKFNLGFEVQTDEKDLPKGWHKWGQYELSVDETNHSGKKSGKITADESGSSFGSIAYRIPANYKGQTIRLEGFMKIKNVENGFAGLLLRIDGNGSPLVFDNMKSQEITGTKDWEKYSITLAYPEEAENIFVAGILVGKGEAWFDDFKISIDYQNIQTLQEVKKEVFKAKLDKEFDEGSAIKVTELDNKQIENLELLGRVWGFLKYHHPEIAKGNYNWDYELFRFLPQYLKTASRKKRDQLIINWINQLGELEKCRMCRSVDKEAFLKPDLKWIKDQKSKLRKTLLTVYKSRHYGKHYYIDMAHNIGNPKFKNELAHRKMAYPDDGFRLLSLFRYWNMIHYYFPYKHLMDENWNTKLTEYIPVFLNAKNELEYEYAAIQLIGDIQDTHANLFSSADKIDQEKGENYPPVHVRFIENQLVVTDFYNPELKSKIGLEIGDIITEINGKTVQELIKEHAGNYPASNMATKLRNLSADLLRSNSTEIEINYIREAAKELSKKLELYPRKDLNIYSWYRKNEGKSYKMLDNNIGYITLQSIKYEDIVDIKEEFKNTKGIIIDIRNYPSSFVPFQLGSYFISAPTPFVKFTQGSINNPGEFRMTDPLEIKNEENPYKGKLIVLVNELSQSQAEYTAMAFRAGDNTTIIGSTTAGADGNVSTITLPGGLKTRISGIGIYYPDGKETQRIGIVPDIEVKPTIEGIKKGKDELMEKAIETILKK